MEHWDDKREYHVVVNAEEQYSLWPCDKDAPAGWKEVGTPGTYAKCLALVEQLWTDMRPLSVRRTMASSGR